MITHNDVCFVLLACIINDIVDVYTLLQILTYYLYLFNIYAFV